MDVLEYYANNQWDFDNKHAVLIRSKMTKTEKIRFKIDVEGIVVYDYFESVIIGARRYLLKQPDETLPAARRMMKL